MVDQEGEAVSSDRSDRSPQESQPRGRLRPSGGYRKLRSFEVTTIIYDATVSFCARFLDKRSRTVDQMVQAARSGRQNIAEGSRASAISSQTELRLVNARISERQKQHECPTAGTPLPCPRCGKLMVLRTARQGARAGSQFWGCTGYPQCKGTRQSE